MNRQEFVAALRAGLSGLPQEDIEKSIDFYNEMIDDRMEDGLTEEEATAAIGPVNEIVSQILSETSSANLVKAKGKTNGAWKAWEMVLLILGFPVWFPLLLAAAIIVLAVYLVIWSVIITLYAADLTFAVGGVAGVAGIVAYVSSGNVAGAVLFLGASLVSAGLAILLFFGFNQVTKGTLFLSKMLFIGSRSLFTRRRKSA